MRSIQFARCITSIFLHHEVNRTLYEYAKSYSVVRNLLLQENEMIYTTENEVAIRQPWKNVTLSVMPSNRFNHTMSYLIQELDSATQYQAKVFSKNRFGWSESDTFRFHTRGTGMYCVLCLKCYVEVYRDVHVTR